MSLADAFREIRRQWFDQQVQPVTPSPLGHGPDLRDEYDRQTEAIIAQVGCLGMRVCPLKVSDIRKGQGKGVDDGQT